jgi:hypothetical protein
MAGKVAKSNERRKARYKSHPTRLASNALRRRNSHLTALRKKLRKFERYVQAGKMTEVAFSAAKERIEKEIKYTLGELKRPEPDYKKGLRRKRAETEE